MKRELFSKFTNLHEVRITNLQTKKKRKKNNKNENEKEKRKRKNNKNKNKNKNKKRKITMIGHSSYLLQSINGKNVLFVTSTDVSIATVN